MQQEREAEPMGALPAGDVGEAQEGVPRALGEGCPFFKVPPEVLGFPSPEL